MSGVSKIMGGTFRDHFSTVASQYADFRPHYPSDLFDYIATLVPRASVVWDCAAGNGQATVDLAARFDKVIATDASAEQIASATQHPRVEYRVATGEESGLPDGTIGLITVAQALHWFDLSRFWPEVKRVLVPGGVIAVWGYGPVEVEGTVINELMRDFYSRVVGPYWPPERKLVEEGYRTISFPFSELSTPTFRMEACWDLDQLLGYASTWSATSRYKKVMGVDPIEPLRSEIGEAWGDHGAVRKIAWPLSLRVGRQVDAPKTGNKVP